MSDFIKGAILLGILILLAFRPWRRQAYDGRTMPDGRTYRFSIGDGLIHYGGFKKFSGISVELPKFVPQVYLDSRRGGGRGAAYIIDASQIISLEGDFDRYFQLYAPAGAETLALSLITPDVMQTLMSVAGEYDIEFNYDRLNLISAKPVFYSRKRQLELQHIMEVLLVEFGRKLSQWPAEYDSPVQDRLLLYPVGGTRIFGRYISIGLIVFNIVWSLATIGWLLVSLIMLFATNSILDTVLPAELFLVFLGVLYVIDGKLLNHDKFRPDGSWYARSTKKHHSTS